MSEKNYLKANIKFLREEKGMSQPQLAEALGCSRDNIASYERGTEPKLGMLQIIVNYFHLTIDDIINKDLSKEEIVNNKTEIAPQTKNLEIATEVMIQYEKRKKKDIITIPMVEIYAAAGHGFMNTESLIPIGEVNLPKSMFRSSGLRYCIRVKGFSMSPTLQDSDYLIIRHLDPIEWGSMSDEHVYLVVDKDGMAYVKRVKNRLDRGFIVLTSDSIEKSSYPNFNLQADEIANIFYAEWHFSAKMQNINETYYDRLKSLEDRFDNIENMLKTDRNE